jgi:DNA-binding NarL/FixJ family response regulator
MYPEVRIVIADDQMRAREALKAVLANFPRVLVVGEAINGLDAVEMVRRCSPDTLLVDVRMPVMDGLEATRLVKTQWPHTRVVVLTMYAAERLPALAAGADAFLLKGGPIECLVDELLSDARVAV